MGYRPQLANRTPARPAKILFQGDQNAGCQTLYYLAAVGGVLLPRNLHGPNARADGLFDAPDHLSGMVFDIGLEGQWKGTTVSHLCHHEKHGVGVLRCLVIPAAIWGRLVFLVYAQPCDDVGDRFLADGDPYYRPPFNLPLCGPKLLLSSKGWLASVLGHYRLQLGQ